MAMEDASGSAANPERRNRRGAICQDGPGSEALVECVLAAMTHSDLAAAPEDKPEDIERRKYWNRKRKPLTDNCGEGLSSRIQDNSFSSRISSSENMHDSFSSRTSSDSLVWRMHEQRLSSCEGDEESEMDEMQRMEKRRRMQWPHQDGFMGGLMNWEATSFGSSLRRSGGRWSRTHSPNKSSTSPTNRGSESLGGMEHGPFHLADVKEMQQSPDVPLMRLQGPHSLREPDGPVDSTGGAKMVECTSPAARDANPLGQDNCRSPSPRHFLQQRRVSNISDSEEDEQVSHTRPIVNPGTATGKRVHSPAARDTEADQLLRMAHNPRIINSVI